MSGSSPAWDRPYGLKLGRAEVGPPESVDDVVPERRVELLEGAGPARAYPDRGRVGERYCSSSVMVFTHCRGPGAPIPIIHARTSYITADGEQRNGRIPMSGLAGTGSGENREESQPWLAIVWRVTGSKPL